MADDENVTELPSNGKVKTPDQILKEIQTSIASKNANEFKKKAEAALEEVNKAEKNLKLAKANLNKIIDEYKAENGI